MSARLAAPGSTVVAGQAAETVLRSSPNVRHRGEVQRVDLVGDAGTEERIVYAGFGVPPDPVAIGDLVKVTIDVAQLADARSIPAAAVKRVGRQDGVWRHDGSRVAFIPVKLGVTTLDGRTQILDGLGTGDEVVVHSEQALRPDARVQSVTAIVRAGT